MQQKQLNQSKQQFVQQQYHNHHHHNNNNHHQQQHNPHQQAIALTVEPAAPLEQTEKLEIKLEESPQHRELQQLNLLRTVHNKSPHFGSNNNNNNFNAINNNKTDKTDFENELTACKISNALTKIKMEVQNDNSKIDMLRKRNKVDDDQITPPVEKMHKLEKQEEANDEDGNDDDGGDGDGEDDDWEDVYQKDKDTDKEQVNGNELMNTNKTNEDLEYKIEKSTLHKTMIEFNLGKVLCDQDAKVEKAAGVEKKTKDAIDDNHSEEEVATEDDKKIHDNI